MLQKNSGSGAAMSPGSGGGAARRLGGGPCGGGGGGGCTHCQGGSGGTGAPSLGARVVEVGGGGGIPVPPPAGAARCALTLSPALMRARRRGATHRSLGVLGGACLAPEALRGSAALPFAAWGRGGGGARPPRQGALRPATPIGP